MADSISFTDSSAHSSYLEFVLLFSFCPPLSLLSCILSNSYYDIVPPLSATIVSCTWLYPLSPNSPSSIESSFSLVWLIIILTSFLSLPSFIPTALPLLWFWSLKLRVLWRIVVFIILLSSLCPIILSIISFISFRVSWAMFFVISRC